MEKLSGKSFQRVPEEFHRLVKVEAAARALSMPCFIELCVREYLKQATTKPEGEYMRWMK